MKILAIGPYIGSFKEEMFTFRPYARWLMKATEWDKVYLSTHSNRIFLYQDFISEENIFPVYLQFSRDEVNQKGYIHKKISKKDFNLILKKFKDDIIKKEKCNKKDIEIHHLSYSRNTPPYSIYSKSFEGIPEVDVNIHWQHKNRIVFIPAKEEKLDKIAYVYNMIKTCYNCLVVGSTDTWFSDDNIVLNKIDYFESGFKYIIQYIAESRAVICPLSYWTGIANMMGKPVFSWGRNPSLYREGGIYNFDNKKCNIIPSNKDTDPNIIIKCIETFIKEGDYYNA